MSTVWSYLVCPVLSMDVSVVVGIYFGGLWVRLGARIIVHFRVGIF